MNPNIKQKNKKNNESILGKWCYKTAGWTGRSEFILPFGNDYNDNNKVVKN